MVPCVESGHDGCCRGAKVCAARGTALLATRRLRPERIFKTIDWPLLVFFAALFVVTHALGTRGLTERLFTLLGPLARAGLVPFGQIAVVPSNLVGNVPAVLLLQGPVLAFPDLERAWLMLAATATLASNLTLVGSVANLITAELAGRWGVRITFHAYLQVGVPVTILTVLVCPAARIAVPHGSAFISLDGYTGLGVTYVLAPLGLIRRGVARGREARPLGDVAAYAGSAAGAGRAGRAPRVGMYVIPHWSRQVDSAGSLEYTPYS